MIDPVFSERITSLRDLVSFREGIARPSRAVRDAHILHVLESLGDGRLRRSTEDNLAAFDRGWSENYDDCVRDGISMSALRPKYVKPYPLLRFGGDYASSTVRPLIHDDLLCVGVEWALRTYFADVDDVYEFGCGTGRYMFLANTVIPGKRYHGSDWTDASQRILGLMADHGLPVDGFKFDFLEPDAQARLATNSGVLTVGALEQVGERHEAFLDYLLAQGPKVVVHFEPIVDFYDPTQLFDQLAIRYHRHRGYLEGFYPRLRALSEQGRIEILQTERTGFGSPYHESGSCIVWRPR